MANASAADAGSAAADFAGGRGRAGADAVDSGLDTRGGEAATGARRRGAAGGDEQQGAAGGGPGGHLGAGVRNGRNAEPGNAAAPARIDSRPAPTRVRPRSGRGGREEGVGFGGGFADLIDRAPSPRLKAAAGLLAVGAVALTGGAILPVSPDAGPGYLSWPLLALLALVPAGVANAAAYSGRHGLAAGLTVGLAALAPGRLLLDFQFFAQASKTIRPELFLPDRLLDRSAVGAGFWLLVVGHVVTIVAGVVAARVVREVNEVAGDDGGHRRWRLVVPLLAVVSAVGLLMAPVVSDNPYLPAYSAFEGPGVALAGYVIATGALLLAVVLGCAAAADGVVRGTLGGVAAATFALALPPLVGGLAISGLHLAFGPVMAVVAMLIVLFLAPRTTPQQARAERTDLAGEARVPSLTLWRGVTALAALLTAVAAAVGALAPQLDARLATQSPARWWLLAAAILVVLPAPFLFKYKAARGLVAVLWAGVVLAGTAVLSTALTASAATGLGGGLGGAITYRLGAGAVFTAIALGLAGLTGLAAVVTGVVERDDEGTEGPRARVLLPVAAAAVLAIAAFGTPVFSAPDYATPGLWSDFDTPSWGLLTAVLVVLGALALSVRSRPGAAAAALAGAALLLALHVSQLFFVDLPGRSPALGSWLGLAAVVATATAGATAAAGAKTPAGVRSHTA
ncbi:hypothetical protein [Amycolatopsis sp. FDAARGOS 1241]|uniref:hypothetical protein n=1 Tax=Amycolatopsis sp. FDAARGOS 1241 TaxID=2778070 RepID=UPI00194EAAA7|nr:hypothetical protein [Amycolatopsis sp. FDAARGOS 1241]QRP45293.1 hypothetical protein I6J71_40070 [Amycolatopsis sp. FDAARGOS 1241]